MRRDRRRREPGRRPRAVTGLPALFGVLAVVAVIGGSPAVRADVAPLGAESTLDALLWSRTPYPVEDLLVHIPGVPASRGDRAVEVSADAGVATVVEDDGTVALDLHRIAADHVAAKVYAPLWTEEKAPAFSLALWYRWPYTAPDSACAACAGPGTCPDGQRCGADGRCHPFGPALEPCPYWNPVAYVGRVDESFGGEEFYWDTALVLDEGVPVVHLEFGDRVLFNDFRESHGDGGRSLRVDDGDWHHLAITFHPTCAAWPGDDGIDTACGSEFGAVPGVLRLFVDGSLRDEAYIHVRHDTNLVATGALPKAYAPPGGFSQANAEDPGDGIITLGTVGRVRDLFFYGRALTTGEILQLRHKAKAGLRALFPHVSPSQLDYTTAPVAWETGTELGPRAIEVGRDDSVDLLRSVGPEEDLVHTLVQDLHGGLTAEGGGPVEWTLVSWVAVADAQSETYVLPETALRFIVTLQDPDGGELFDYTLELNAAGRLRARCPALGRDETARLHPETYGGGWSDPMDRGWHLVGIAKHADGYVYAFVDGVPYPTLGCVTDDSLPAGGRLGLERVNPPELDQGVAAKLGWAALYDQALSSTEQLARAATGPAVWLNPDIVGNEVAPLDVVGRFPVRWNRVNSPLNGRFEPGAPNAIWASAAEILAVGALSNAAAPGRAAPFTVSLGYRTEWTNQADATGHWYQLAARRPSADPASVDTGVWVHCDRDACDRLFVAVPDDQGVMQGYLAEPPEAMAHGVEHTVTVSWPYPIRFPLRGEMIQDDAAHVAVDGVPLNGRTAESMNYVNPVPADYEWSPQSWVLPNATQPPVFEADGVTPWELVWSIGPGESALYADAKNIVFTIDDARLYPYAIDDVSVLAGTCETLSCATPAGDGQGGADDFGGRTCYDQSSLDAFADLTAVCGVCLDSHFPVSTAAGGVGQECRPKYDPMTGCEVSEVCRSGGCHETYRVCGRDACDGVCFDIGRDCQTVAMIGNGSAGWCQGCRFGFERAGGDDGPADDAPELQCNWAPTLDALDECEYDILCRSGRCVSHTEDVYDVDVAETLHGRLRDYGRLGHDFLDDLHDAQSTTRATTQTRNVCAVSDAADCGGRNERAHRFPEGVEIELPDHTLGQIWDCGAPRAGSCPDGTPPGGGPEMCDCVESYTPRWTVMSPDACLALIERSRELDPGHPVSSTPYGSYHNYVLAPRLYHLAPAAAASLLYERFPAPSGVNARAHLLDIGVGERLLRFLESSPAERAALHERHGAFLPLARCVVGAYPEHQYGPSAYRWPDNVPACAPKLQPDGGHCRDERFCLSGYCAPDSHACEQGMTEINDTHGKTANQAKEGQKSVSFGFVKYENRTARVRDEGAAEGTSSAAKDAWTGDWNYRTTFEKGTTLRLFGHDFPGSGHLFGYQVDVTGSGAEPSRCASNRFELQVFGMDVLSPFVPDSKPGLASCSAYVEGASTDPKAHDICPSDPQATCDVEPSISTVVADLVHFMTPTSGLFCIELIPLFKKLAGPEAEAIRTDFPIPLVPGPGVSLVLKLTPGMDLCAAPDITLTSSGLPTLKVMLGARIKIVARLGLEAALSDDIGFFVGLRIVVNLVNVQLKSYFYLALEQAVCADDQQPIDGLFLLQMRERMDIVASFFDILFQISVEFRFLFFTAQKVWTLLQVNEVQFIWNILDRSQDLARLDFTGHCGDLICQATETATSCATDCGKCNNDGHCDTASGESSCRCPHDCVN